MTLTRMHKTMNFETCENCLGKIDSVVIFKNANYLSLDIVFFHKSNYCWAFALREPSYFVSCSCHQDKCNSMPADKIEEIIKLAEGHSKFTRESCDMSVDFFKKNILGRLSGLPLTVNCPRQVEHMLHDWNA